MPDTLINEHAFQVLTSFRPFLGERGSNIMTAMESLQELLASEPGKKTVESFRSFGLGEKFTTLEVVSETEPNPFNLFLILVLLVLADLPDLTCAGDPGVEAETVKPVVPVQVFYP